MYTSTAETLSSVISYLAGKEPAIVPTDFERMAAANRLAIQQGKVEGLQFPDPPARKKPVWQKPSNPKDDRVRIVKAVNKLRMQGVEARKAAKQCGVHYQTYYNWSNNLGIKPPPRSILKTL